MNRESEVRSRRSAVSGQLLSADLWPLIADLFPLCRSISGDGLRATLRYLQGRLKELEIHEVPTGTQVFDWEVPREWNIKDAWIKNARGDKIVDFQKSNLHVVNYSVPFEGRLTGKNLKEHLHSLPDHPDWIPYRTSYYHETWGFCLEHRRWLEVKDDETYEVCIDATLEPGHLTYGELFVPGRTEDEVLVSCHCCHPSLANDNLSGIAVATGLAQHVQSRENRYSYRFLFIPGTIGSITWLALHENPIPSPTKNEWGRAREGAASELDNRDIPSPETPTYSTGQGNERGRVREGAPTEFGKASIPSPREARTGGGLGRGDSFPTISDDSRSFHDCDPDSKTGAGVNLEASDPSTLNKPPPRPSPARSSRERELESLSESTFNIPNDSPLRRIKHGLVLSCLGDPGKFHYKRSRRGDAEIDRMVAQVLKESGGDHVIMDFVPSGYDERQYCSPGINLPVGCFMRTPNGQYPEYHTSVDNLNLIDEKELAGSLDMLIRVVEGLEANDRYLNLQPKGEPQLGRRGLYRKMGGDKGPGHLEQGLLWVLNYSDGIHSLLDVAEKSALTMETLHESALALQSHGLLAKSEK